MASSDDIKREICNAISQSLQENNKEKREAWTSKSKKETKAQMALTKAQNSLKTASASEEGPFITEMPLKSFNAGIDKFDIKGRKRYELELATQLMNDIKIPKKDTGMHYLCKRFGDAIQMLYCLRNKDPNAVRMCVSIDRMAVCYGVLWGVPAICWSTPKEHPIIYRKEIVENENYLLNKLYNTYNNVKKIASSNVKIDATADTAADAPDKRLLEYIASATPNTEKLDKIIKSLKLDLSNLYPKWKKSLNEINEKVLKHIDESGKWKEDGYTTFNDRLGKITEFLKTKNWFSKSETLSHDIKVNGQFYYEFILSIKRDIHKPTKGKEYVTYIDIVWKKLMIELYMKLPLFKMIKQIQSLIKKKSKLGKG